MVGAEESEDHRGGGGEFGEPFREARTFRPVTVFVPPAVFQEEDAVFDFPVTANGGQKFGGRDVAWIEAGNEVASILKNDGAVVARDVAIHSQQDLGVGELQFVPNVCGVIQVQP